MTTTMFDNINVGAIGVGDEEAGYVNGRWPTWSALVAEFPHKPVLSIAVNAAVRADALDIEKGDATIGQAAGWFHGWVRRIVDKPIFYISASLAPALIAALTAAGIPRDAYYLWTAHYTYTAHLCGPQCREGNFNADMTQWTDRIGGDESLVEDYVFTQATPPIPTPAPPPSVGPALPIPGDTAMNVDFSCTTGTDGTAYVEIPIPVGCTKIAVAGIDVGDPNAWTPPHHDGDITGNLVTGVNAQPAVAGPAIPGVQKLRLSGGIPNHFYTGHAILV